MLPVWFTLFSIVIRLYSGTQYGWGVLHDKARPNPVTWFLWGLTPLIALLAQLQYGLHPQVYVLIALAVSPFAICALTLLKHDTRRHFTPFTLICGVLAVLGVILWRVTSIPELAIVFSILADIFATLPTLRKAYHDQSSEYALPYFLSMASMFITLLTIQDWAFAVYAFPLYMLIINMVLWAFASFPIRKLVYLGERDS
jgi:hypothetical protein